MSLFCKSCVKHVLRCELSLLRSYGTRVTLCRSPTNKFIPYELKVGRQHAVPTVSMHHKSRWKRRAAILLDRALCQCYGMM